MKITLLLPNTTQLFGAFLHITDNTEEPFY